MHSAISIVFRFTSLVSPRWVARRAYACVAQLVEHFLGKEEVTGSIPVASSVEEPRV